MRAFRVLALMVTALLVGIAPAQAHAQESDLPEKTPRHVRRARAYVKRGRQELERAQKKESNAQKLKTLDRALLYLRRARSFSDLSKHPELAGLEAEATTLLVTGLNRQARIYLDRKSLPLARKRVREALAANTMDPTAIELKKAVDAAEDGEDYFAGRETSGVEQRTRARRFRSSVPTTGRAAGRSR